MKIDRYYLANLTFKDYAPESEWCQSTDVKKLEQENERLREENERLKKENWKLKSHIRYIDTWGKIL